MNHKMILVILTLCCYVQSAAAEMTGNSFMDFCEVPRGQGAICTALVTGLLAGFNAGYGNGMQGAITGLKGEAWESENQETLTKLFNAGRICLADTVTPDQATTIVIKFFQDNPSFGDKSVADGLSVIFRGHLCDRV